MSQPRIVTPGRVSSGTVLTAQYLNRMSEAIESLSVGGTQTTRGTFPYSRRPVRSASGLDLSLFAFGASCSAEIVTVNAGEIQHGARTPIPVAGDDITITLDLSYIWVEYVIGSGSAALAGPSTTKPVSDDTTMRRWLYLISFSESGTADIKTIGHVGNITIDSIFA